MSFASQRAFVFEQRDAAMATIMPWAGARAGGAYDRVVEKHDKRSRLEGAHIC